MKKNTFFIFLLAAMVVLSSCSITQAIRLKDCTYTYSRISDITVMDMDGKEQRTLSGIIQLGRALMGKTNKVTVGCTIHLTVHNPNKQAASVDRIFYTVSLDSIDIAEGSNADAFIVAGDSNADMPIKINIDVKTLLQKHSRATVINICKNFLHMSDTPTLVTVNLKPVVRVAGVAMAIPKAIPLTFEYGGKK